MPRGRRLGAEQIVTKLRQIEVLQGQGKSLAARNKASIDGGKNLAASMSTKPSGSSSLRTRTAG